MKKAGLYDKNRYPYNARLLQSANASFDSRGNDVTLGSGVRTHNTSRASRPRYRSENPNMSSDTRSQNGSDRMSDFSGFSDTASKHSMASSKPRSVAAPLGSGYVDRTQMAMSVWSTDELVNDDEVRPSVRIATKFAYTAFVLQLFCVLLILIVLISPGWGKAKEDLRTDDDVRGKQNAYFGLWMHCTAKQYEEYLGDLNCLNSTIIGMEAWWTICQVFCCVFLMLSITIFIMICFYVFRRKSNRRWPLAVCVAIFSAINCGFLVTTVVLFAVKFLDDSWWCCPNDNEIVDADLFWCWYLAVAAVVCQLVTFIMALVESINLRR